MEFFYERFVNAVKDKKRFKYLNRWIAGNLSLYPAGLKEDQPRSWLPHYVNAREAQIILLLALFRPSWEVWEIVARIKESCYFHKYQGSWQRVQEILEQVEGIQDMNEKSHLFGSEDTIFGNLTNQAEQFLRRNNKKFLPVTRDRHKPRRSLRTRGYKDKGSLRPQHSKYRNLPDPDPGEDRREKVRYARLPFI